MTKRVRITCQDCLVPYLAGPGGKYCPGCRWKHRGKKTKKYVWTDEKDALLRQRYDGKVPNRSKAIASQLGWPCWVIRKRAAALGLCTPWPADRKDWTREEEAFLEQHAGTRHVNWLRRKLNRSLTSVVLKIKRMGFSRSRSDGYSLRDLEACFGIDHHGIERWVREGKLKVRHWNPEHPAKGGMWFVTQSAVLRFVRTHPMAFRLDKVDQVWFLDLVLGGNLLDRSHDHCEIAMEAEAV